MKVSRIAGRLGLLLIGAPAMAEEPRPAIAIRVDRPDRQVREVLELFEGARAPHPAAALAAWKRASREPGRLGKPLEALIAAFNPRMADEVRTLDGAEWAFWFDPPDGRPAWGASLPNDDGTFAALGAAMVLSGGRVEAPVDDLAVDRLGGPGAPLMARGPAGLLMAGSPEGLRVAQQRSTRLEKAPPVPGLRLIVEPGALLGSRATEVRRLAEILGPMAGSIVAHAEVDDGAAWAQMIVLRDEPARPVEVEGGWLDWIPADRAMAGFAIAVDREAASWEAAFGLADRVERVDPVRSNVAPLRLRLDLLGRSLGVRTEVDLFPHLLGLSGWVGSGGEAVDSGLLAIHLADEAAAERLAARVRPASGPGTSLKSGESRPAGQLGGRPIRLARAGRSVAIGWGEGAVEASMAALDDPARSAGAILRAGWDGRRPAIAGGAWPARVPGLIPEGSPLAQAVAEAPPVTWSATWDGPKWLRIEMEWDQLKGTVRRFLDRLPLDPPPDR